MLADIKAKLLRSARSEAHLKIANFKDFKIFQNYHKV
jgi:hypothetical protein